LLVLDGMNAAVFRQIIRDIEHLEWTEIANDALGVPRPVLATLPSVTQISRRALFLGRLDPSKSGTEQGEFSGNDFLLQATGSQVRPKLFLKGDLQEQGYGGLATEVRTALADKRCRVVGVVVNAIDDHLDSGNQVVFTWGVDRIKPLRELLKLATDAGRLVLMTSDHGHVLDFGTRQLNTTGGDAGDRYRMNTESIKDGEIVFESVRVEKATGQKKVTLAWSSDVRYAAQKRGYHGGANPQEMVIPFAILRGPNSMPSSGWKEVPPFEPEWWRTVGWEAAIKVTGAEGKRPREKDVDAVKGLDLFEQAKAKKDEASQTWIDALLESKIYLEQLKLGVRGGPQREVITTLITTIDARGGSIMKPSLAQALGVPLFRVDGLVQNISRILNVDGYEVLSFDRSTETITLNTKLLKTQFEIE
jgi:PglZ domain